MRCCVPGCKNDSRHISKSQGITFHVFPNEITLRTAWLRALNKVQWVPRERSAVCSEHFVSADLYQTRSGLRKVRVGAVPFILQDTLSCDYEPCNLNICRVCLAMDCKLFSINEYNLKQAYECLTGVTVYEGEKLPQMLCYECVARLNNCNRFRSQCVRANALMVDIIKKDDQLTIENIKTINRDTNQLNSPLLWEIYPPNHCNYHCEEDELKTEPIEIKSEKNEVYLTDDELIDDKQHGVNDIPHAVNDIPHAVNDIPHAVNDIPHAVNDIPHAVNDIPHAVNDIPHAVNDIPHAVNDVPQDTNEILDNVHSDNDYSTDDSLPLQKARKKRKLEKKSVKVRKTLIKRDPTEPKVDRRRKPFLNGDLNETLFTITDLTHEEQLAEIDKRRESANYKNAVFKCTECYKGFLDEDAYNTHMTRHTDKCGEHACEICKTHFKHPHALRKHITAHHTQRFSCNQCVYVTTHRQTARLHERWHKGTKYHCPHCQDEFVKFTTYMGHIRIKHPSDFVCELCGYSFVSIKGIELHKKLKHRLEDGQVPEDGPFCELCNVRFVSMEAHRRHLNVSARHSAGREANKPKGRKSKETMEREKREREKNREPESKRRYPSQVRKAEGPIPCEQCGVQLEDSRAYHGHFRKVHPDKNRTKYPSMKSPCMCEVCGRMFQSHALLKDHRWVHTGERPFQCDSCDKSFRMKQRLVAHRRVHSQVKASYGCTLCGKNFSTHSNRQRHMFIHTGLKPFKCEMCGKGFKHASEKRAHITYVHLKKPWPKRSRGKRRSDSRQGMLPQHSIPTREMDTVQPIWPPCDPKMADMNMIEDKPMYYTLKI